MTATRYVSRRNARTRLNNSIRIRARTATNQQAQLLPGRITPLNENPPLGRSREAHQNEPESYAVRGSDVGRTDGRTDGRKGRLTDDVERMDGRTDGRMDGQGQTEDRKSVV